MYDLKNVTVREYDDNQVIIRTLQCDATPINEVFKVADVVNVT